ncbi:hypothetical protein Hypma_005008 [Hypsizygus marmoreus]|uniref:DUF6589 domain-containing protein n=1 Tax=Hypsizygus marmoreus TaxID=39966 RepID=A0A369JXN0_HYPMA|nr:hypothetical protein Hypma_005008 [Hypsizygus marmoreus]
MAQQASLPGRRRNVIFSSDDLDIQAIDQLPPSDPPSESSDSEACMHDSSESVPLFQLLDMAERSSSPFNFVTPRPRSRFRPRSSSLPGEAYHAAQELSNIASDNDALHSPTTERKIRNMNGQIKRRATMARKKTEREQAEIDEKVVKEAFIAEEKKREALAVEIARIKREAFFDDELRRIHHEGYTLAQFLDYVFNPANKFESDWRWKGFFFHKSTVERILGYWTTSKYNKTTRTLITGWAQQLVGRLVGKESRAVTRSGLLKKTNKAINEDYFLSYSITDLTNKLRAYAPTAFGVFDAFSTTKRQLQEMSSDWFKKKNVLTGSAALTLLRGASQNNSYAQSIHSTYLMATGGQRQHFSVFTSLGMSMGYTSVISQGDRHTRTNEGEADPTLPSNTAKTVVEEGTEDMPALEECDDDDEDENDTMARESDKPKRTRKPGTLFDLSNACRKSAREIAATGLFVTVYDNINMMVRVAEQILGRKNAQENGTCATIFPLHNVQLENLRTEDLDQSILNAPELKLETLELTTSESEFLRECLEHTILRVIVIHGGRDFLARWRKDLDGCQPSTSEKIAVHKTPIHPLPAMDIEENTTTGNVEVMDAIISELGLKLDDPEYAEYVKIIAGDQLTIARQRAILNVRLGHEDRAHSWKNIVLMPGLFHAKIADCHGLLEVHFGKANAGVRSPGSLAFHNTVLDRIPIVLSSLPTFRVCRDLIMVSLYGRILHCLLLVSGTSTLDEYLDKTDSWATVKMHAHQILERFTDSGHVQELREMREPEERRREAEKKATKKGTTDPDSDATPLGHVQKGDMVYENAILFLRDALLTREFTDAIKCGDSGRVVTILKLWALAYRGSGRTKYAHEMLHLLHNLLNVWSTELRSAITQNWLLNPTGKENAFVEVDLVQEHLNFWIKKIYKADGDAHSWDWLALVSPCVDVLRRLATRIHGDLGARQGSRHTVPELDKDIETLMKSLAEHEVYVEKLGRVLDPDEKPAPDVLSAGLAALSHGSSSNPIADFNDQFNRLRAHRQLQPITVLLQQLEALPTAIPVILGDTLSTEMLPGAPMNIDSDSDDSDMPPLTQTADSSADELSEDLDNDVLSESPTLERIDEQDVALDMDFEPWYLDDEENNAELDLVSSDSGESGSGDVEGWMSD